MAPLLSVLAKHLATLRAPTVLRKVGENTRPWLARARPIRKFSPAGIHGASASAVTNRERAILTGEPAVVLDEFVVNRELALCACLSARPKMGGIIHDD